MASEKSDFNPQDLGSFPDPLAPFLSQPELPQETTQLPNRKRFYKPASFSRDQEKTGLFPAPIVNATNTDSSVESGYDAHICYDTADALSLNYARRLHSAIRYTFPHLRVYQMFDEPAGPFPKGSFEVALFSPADFAEFLPWLTLWHGPLSAIIHTNTKVEGKDPEDKRAVNDHTIRALWIGEKMPLVLERLGGGPGPRRATRQTDAGAVVKKNKVGDNERDE